MNIDLLGNIVGYIGMFLCVFAFFMVQKTNPNMLVYNIINLVASGCLFCSLCIHFNIASISLEIFWIAGSIYGIVKNWRKRKASKMK